MYKIAALNGDIAVIDFDFKATFISTMPYQPRESSSIVFKRVDEDFNPGDLRGYYEGVREHAGRGDAIVFLTSVDLGDRLLLRELREPRGFIAASIGLGPPACPGMSGREPLRTGTINVAVVLDESLTESGLADLLRVVAEAKCLASVELLLRCSLRSPGTVTDSIAVGAREERSGGYVNAGMATSIGGPVAEAVYRLLVGEGTRILGPEGMLRNALGLTVDGLVELAVEAYRRAPVPGVSEDSVRREAERLLRGIISDPNVASLIIASRDLDLRGYVGALPGVGEEEFRSDTKRILADELIAMAISLYVAGVKGLFATYWVERLKEKGLISIDLPPFEDDVVSALVGSILTLIYDKLLGAGR